jgi:hypothetical protein
VKEATMRAKFECLKAVGGQIHLRAEPSGSGPSGQILMFNLSADDAEAFRVGESYFVDFQAAADLPELPEPVPPADTTPEERAAARRAAERAEQRLDEHLTPAPEEPHAHPPRSRRHR